MRFIRREMRSNRQLELTVPQFRSLVFLNLQPASSLSAMAEHLGLSLPATSRMVDLLVHRRLVQRRIQSKDRRTVALSLTRQGRDVFLAARNVTQSALAGRFEKLSAQDRTVIITAMSILQRTFASPVNGATS